MKNELKISLGVIMEITEYHPFKSFEAKEKYLKMYDTRTKEWPIPSEVRIADTSFGETLVRISGPKNAKPLVLLHGVGSNSLAWIPNIGILSKHYKTYAVDGIYGNGRSICTKTIKDPTEFVEWLDELVIALEIGNSIHIMGYSYGGWLTGQYSLKFPEKLNKIVLLAPSATVLPVSKIFMARAILCAIPHDYFLKSFARWTFKDCIKKDKKEAEKEINPMLMASKCFKSNRPPRSTVLNDDELKNIKVPALFLVGENEKLYPAKKAVQRLNIVAPQIKTEFISEAGHDLLFVQTERVNKIVLEFLK